MAEKRTLEDLAKMGASEVDVLFQQGTQPDPALLVGWEFRGYNLPLITKIAGFQKFRKGFYEHDGAVWGYNVPVAQGSLDRPWDCRPSNDDPKRFGFYRVSIVDDERGAKVRGAILLNYAHGKNGLFEGSFLRDYVRKVDPDNNDLYIGRAYTSLGGAQILPTLFIIQRDRRAPTPVRHRD